MHWRRLGIFNKKLKRNIPNACTEKIFIFFNLCNIFEQEIIKYKQISSNFWKSSSNVPITQAAFERWTAILIRCLRYILNFFSNVLPSINFAKVSKSLLRMEWSNNFFFLQLFVFVQFYIRCLLCNFARRNGK